MKREAISAKSHCVICIFFVYQRPIDRPTGVLGGGWSFGFQRAAANSNRGLDHLFLLGFGPGHHQLVAKQLPSPFSILVR